MKDSEETGRGARALRGRLVFRFLVLGVTAGFMAGLCESALIYFDPSVREFLQTDATWVAWFLAPLVDVTLFALVGLVLGCAAAVGQGSSTRRAAILAAALIALAGAWMALSLHFVHTHGVNLHVYDGTRWVLFPATRFIAILAVALAGARLGRARVLALFDANTMWPLRKASAAIVCVFLAMSAGTGLYSIRSLLGIVGRRAHARGDPARPNIVLITMDTVRADHLSAYGYSRLTTPNIDHLVARGVVFENAVSPVSWTLPSLAAIFTGLLPHQSGANAFRPISPGWVTLAEELEEHGYSTAGFNANYFYGESGWGLGRGFETYDDDRTTLRYNLSRTLLGRLAVQPVYQNVSSYGAFYRRTAAALNQDVFAWLRNHGTEPFFLYVNYYDAHSPYRAPTPLGDRFGKLSGGLVRRIGYEGGFRPSTPLTAGEQAELIAGYDDSLAYLDAQVGWLLLALEASPGWNNTIVIITSDHGEAFGEHGAYQHGCDLHREEIHVPLIIAGPGIPAGRKIEGAVGIRRLFGTVLDFALGKSFPFHSLSLSRYWEPGFRPPDYERLVVSELSSSLSEAGESSISVVAGAWHYIKYAAGHEELYRWDTDPAEKNDLSRDPKYHGALDRMRAGLDRRVGRSVKPWLGPEYLAPMDPGNRDFPAAFAHPEPSAAFNLGRTGVEQTYFSPNVPESPRQVTASQRDLLESLPYH